MSKSVIITPAIGRIEFEGNTLDPSLSVRFDIEANGALTVTQPVGTSVSFSSDISAVNGYFQGDVVINNINVQHLMIAYSIALG